MQHAQPRRSEFTARIAIMAHRLAADGTRHDPRTSSRHKRSGAEAMSAVLLWLLILAVGIYLLIAMLRPDKF